MYQGWLTRPPLFSSHAAFLRASVCSEPALVATMVDGGIWRRPGPRVRVLEVFPELGNCSAASSSPGSSTWGAIGSAMVAVVKKLKEGPMRERRALAVLAPHARVGAMGVICNAKVPHTLAGAGHSTRPTIRGYSCTLSIFAYNFWSNSRFGFCSCLLCSILVRLTAVVRRGCDSSRVTLWSLPLQPKNSTPPTQLCND